MEEEGVPICPRCGVTMVLKEAMYGLFYGCQRYPHCEVRLPLRYVVDGSIPEELCGWGPRWRRTAQIAFDRLWKWQEAPLSREEAYEQLVRSTYLCPADAHLCIMGEASCRNAARWALRRHKELQRTEGGLPIVGKKKATKIAEQAPDDSLVHRLAVSLVQALDQQVGDEPAVEVFGVFRHGAVKAFFSPCPGVKIWLLPDRVSGGKAGEVLDRMKNLNQNEGLEKLDVTDLRPRLPEVEEN